MICCVVVAEHIFFLEAFSFRSFQIISHGRRYHGLVLNGGEMQLYLKKKQNYIQYIPSGKKN